MRDLVAEVQALIARLYDGEDACTRETGNVGGHLHVVLDDGNVDDSDVEFCLTEASSETCCPCLAIGLFLRDIPAEKRWEMYEAGWGRRT